MKKEKQIIIRVSEDEKEAFERAAEVAGIGLSGWARQRLRAATITELNAVGESASFLKPKGG